MGMGTEPAFEPTPAGSTAPARAAKWQRWDGVLGRSGDKPKDHPALRRVAVPVICAVVVALALVVITPPFVCADRRPVVSLLRLGIWSAIAGVVCAILASQAVFARWCKA